MQSLIIIYNKSILCGVNFAETFGTKYLNILWNLKCVRFNYNYEFLELCKKHRKTFHYCAFPFHYLNLIMANVIRTY
jgi:hypothetical protein